MKIDFLSSWLQLKTNAAKAQSPRFFYVFIYCMKIWPDAYFWIWNFEKNSSNKFESWNSQIKFFCCKNKHKRIPFQVRALLISKLVFKKIIVIGFSPKSWARLEWLDSIQKNKKQRLFYFNFVLSLLSNQPIIWSRFIDCQYPRRILVLQTYLFFQWFLSQCCRF